MESWISAMRREVKEETGLHVMKERLIGLYSDPSLTVTAEVLPEGYRGQFVVAVFLVTEFSGEITPNEEVDDWDWFGFENLPEPMLKSHPVRVFDALKSKGEIFIR